MRALARNLIAGALLLSGAVGQAATAYRITDLGGLPGTSRSTAHAINDQSQIAGSIGDDGFSSTRASVWWNGVLTVMPETPGVGSSGGYAINARGEVVGRGDGVGSVPFFWSGTTVTNLDPLTGAGDAFVPFGVNAAGQIIGTVQFPQMQARYVYDSQVSPLPVPGTDGFGQAWAISDSGHVVGSASGLGAAYWESATSQPVALPSGAVAHAVNEQGDAAGATSEAVINNRHAALWVERVFTQLPDGPGMGGSQAWGMNDARQVVGHSALTLTHFSTPLSEGRATLWNDGVAFDLNDLIPADSGWTLYIGRDINNLGQIVGEGLNPDGQLRGFLLTPVPEPAQYVILLSGLALLAAIRRRQAQRRLRPRPHHS